MGSRAPWLVALLVAVLTLPILAITVYFEVGIGRQIANVRTELSGLDRVERFERLFTDVSALATSQRCGPASANRSATLPLVDADVDAVADPAIRRAWQTLRASALREADFDAFFAVFETSMVALGDSSGLTFDASVPGIDLGDSLGYRIPPALDRLQRVRRSLCANSAAAMGMTQRIALVEDATHAAQSMSDNADDVADVLDRAEMHDRVAALSAASYRAQSAAGVASADLQTLVTSPSSAPGRAQAAKALDTLIVAYYDLWQKETPVFRALLERRLAEFDRQRLIAVVPGVVGVFAAVLVAFLTMRLVYERAALELAERHAAEQERVAMHDSLTGLLNRRAFIAAMERSIAAQHDGAVCLFDVDDFKAVNDTYGHLTGDDLLINVARIIEASVRSTDAVARLGGDEFAVLLHEPIDRHGVERVLSAIAGEAAAPVEFRGNVVRSSVSAGGTFVYRLQTTEDVLAAADAALYDAKANARGHFVFNVRAAAAET